MNLSTHVKKELSPLRVPKKPHFILVNYDNLDKAKHLRVKLWKPHSFKSVKLHDNLPRRNIDQRKEKLQDTIKHSHFRKCLKYVKKITLHHDLFQPDNPFLLRFFKQWRLDSLSISLHAEMNFFKMLKIFTNARPKCCFLNYMSSDGETLEEDLQPKAISLFRKLKKCQLFITKEFDNIKVLLNTDQLRASSKSQKFIRIESPLRLLNEDMDHGVFNTARSLEKICYETNFMELDIPLNFPSRLPNLKSFDLFVENSNTWQNLDVAFLQQYPRLEFLRLRVDFCKVKNLDVLTDLPNLKEFHLFSYSSIIENALPKLSNLETFLARFDDHKADMDFLGDFLQNNQNLKVLGLFLPLKHIADIFKKHGLKFLNLEKLILNLPKLELPLNIIAQIINNHPSIKDLCIQTEQSSPETNVILLRGLAQINPLESLTLRFLRFPKRIAQYPHLREALLNLKNLTALDLDLGNGTINSQELSSILDALCQLKALKRFRFLANLENMSSFVFDKLLGFLVSIRHLKSFKFGLTGITLEEERIIKENLLPRFTLFQERYNFRNFRE